ncbi:MAG: thiol:disulfide interchange protein DsbA/DsbL [Chloroflexota bacterium]
MWSDFCRVATTFALAAAGTLASAQIPPVAGQDFLVLDPPRPVAPGETIEVIEFFYYGCPVCYESQPHIARWLASAGADVSLTRVPSAFTADGESYALTFHALLAQGGLAQLHGPVYENHHFEDRRLSEEKNLLDWLARNGVDAEAFRAVRHSAQNRARMAEGRRIFEIYGVRAVPAFAVDGRYLTSARLANGVKEMMAVVEHLVERAREDRRNR